MKLLAIMAAASLALAGCNTREDLDAAIQKNIGQICAAAAQTHAVYLAAAPLIPEKQQVRVDRTFATVEAVCANPASANTVTLTAAAAAHIAAIKAAKAAAKE